MGRTVDTDPTRATSVTGFSPNCRPRMPFWPDCLLTPPFGRIRHHAPTVAFEIVSEDWEKDYEAPSKYAQLGCPELVIFAAEVATGAITDPQRVALQHWRREADGALARLHGGRGPVHVAGIDAWVRIAIEPGPVARLRVSRDERGQDDVPTAEERVGQLAAELLAASR